MGYLRVNGKEPLREQIDDIESTLDDVESTLDDVESTLDDVEAETEIVEEHLHNRERWFGKLAVQTATEWGEEAGLIVYRAISGNGDFGSDPNDEALVIGTADTPAIDGMINFDFHRITIDAASNANPYVIRIVYGSGTMADAEGAGQYSDTVITEAKKGVPTPVLMPQTTCTSCKVWIRIKNGTNDATMDFFVGLHEYPA